MELQWYFANSYSEETGNDLTDLFKAEGLELIADICARIRRHMKGTSRAMKSASMMLVRQSVVQVEREPVWILAFLTLEKGEELPSQQAVFLGPHDFVSRKARDIQRQYQDFLQEDKDREGNILVVRRSEKS